MRFIGSLASHALGDLDMRVETEEDRFLHDGFGALAGRSPRARAGLAPEGPSESESATKP